MIGRKKELASLKRLVSKKTASIVTITGRRRVGKSYLIEHFAKQYDCFSFTGIAPTEGVTAQIQRDEFATQLAIRLGRRPFKMDDWSELFYTLADELDHQKQQVILFDEISWMGSEDPSFLGKLKVAWDKYFSKHPNLILIFCGSVSSWIEKNIVSSTGFFGRISLKIRLEPLSLSESIQLLEFVGFKRSLTEQLMVLSLTGGIPFYIEQISRELSAQKNIEQLCFTPNALLLEEFELIFHDLFTRRAPTYQKIVEHLAKGSAEHGVLAEAISYQSGGTLSQYLDDLCLSGFVNEFKSWKIQSAKPGRIMKYSIRDCYLRFYLKYILPNKDKILQKRFAFDSVWHMPNIDSVMGSQLESLLLDNRSLIWQVLGLHVDEIDIENPYFQRPTQRIKGCQIDYLIQTKSHVLYACEFKFNHKPLGRSICSEMKEKLSHLALPKNYVVVPILIHVNGVTDGLLEANYFSRVLSVSELLSHS